MVNQHKSIPTSLLSLNNDYTMPLRDPQHSQGGADINEDNSSLPTTGDWQSKHGMRSSDSLITEFPRELPHRGLARRHTSRRIHKSAASKREVSSNLLPSLSSSLQNLDLHGVVDGHASNDDNSDDFIVDDGMDDSIHLTRRRFNRHHDDCLDYVDDDGMHDSIHLTKQRFNRHRDIFPENDVCMERERDEDEITKRGGIDQYRIINATLPELQLQTLRAMAA